MEEIEKEKIKEQINTYGEMMLSVIAMIEDQELDIIILKADLDDGRQQYKKLEIETEKLLMKHVEDLVKRDEFRVRAGYKKN